MKTPQSSSVFGSALRVRRSPRISSATKDQDKVGTRGDELDSVKRAMFTTDRCTDDDVYPRPPSPLVTAHGSLPMSMSEPSKRAASSIQDVTPSTDIINQSPPPSDLSNCAAAESTSCPPEPTKEGGAVVIDERAEKVGNESLELSCLFFHLNRITAVDQKSIAAAFNVAQIGNKKMRAARIFLEMREVMLQKDCKAIKLLEEKEKKCGDAFRSEYNCTMELYRRKAESTIVPDTQTLQALAGKPRLSRPRQEDKPIDDESDGDDDITAVNLTATRISLEEFSRLLIIFRDIPEAAADLRKSGQDLSREDLDIGRTRGAFWVDRIESLFNDSLVLTNHRFEAPLQDVDPGRPVTEFRTGSFLKDVFTKFRHEFTETYANWDVSGNNDYSNFVNFCYIPRTRTLSRPGARCLIAFKIFRFGLPDQNTLLLDFCSKQMAESAGARLEGGLTSSLPSDGTVSKSNKRLSEDALSEDLRSVVRSLSQNNTNDNAGKKTKAELDVLRLKRARREEDRHVMQQLMETHEHRLKMKHPVDNRVTGIIDNYYKRLVEEADKRMQT